MDRPLDPETGEPFKGIVLNHQRVCCPQHGEPFRVEYPRGFVLFQVKAFQAATAIPGIWAESKQIAGVSDDVENDVRQLEAIFDLKPICCRLPKAQLVALYKECLGAAGLAHKRHCTNCGRKQEGTPYQIMTDQGLVSLKHICFECVVYNMVSTLS